jgi:hypothetical protein
MCLNVPTFKTSRSNTRRTDQLSSLCRPLGGMMSKGGCWDSAPQPLFWSPGTEGGYLPGSLVLSELVHKQVRGHGAEITLENNFFLDIGHNRAAPWPGQARSSHEHLIDYLGMTTAARYFPTKRGSIHLYMETSPLLFGSSFPYLTKLLFGFIMVSHRNYLEVFIWQLLR